MKNSKIIRDEKTKAILNTDSLGLIEYKKKKNINRINDKRISALEDKLDIVIDLIGKMHANNNL